MGEEKVPSVVDARSPTVNIPEAEYQQLLREREQLVAKLSDIQTRMSASSEPKLGRDADKSKIDYIRFDLYYIVTKSEQHRCPVCEKMITLGVLDRLRRFGDIIGIPSARFIFKEWKVDAADRFYRNAPYNDSNSMLGLNYYYAVGRGINKYPALEFGIQIRDKHKIYRVIEGFGKKDEKGELIFDIVESLVAFISNLLTPRVNTVEMDINTAKHKEDVYSNDPLGNKKGLKG